MTRDICHGKKFKYRKEKVMRINPDLIYQKFCEYMDSDFGKYEQFTNMCARGNLYMFSFINLACIFMQKPDANHLHQYKGITG